MCAVEASSRILFVVTASWTSITSNAPFRRWSIALSFADSSWFYCFYASETFGLKHMYSSQSAERSLSFSSLRVKNSIVLIFLRRLSSLNWSYWFALIAFSIFSVSASLTRRQSLLSLNVTLSTLKKMNSFPGWTKSCLHTALISEDPSCYSQATLKWKIKFSRSRSTTLLCPATSLTSTTVNSSPTKCKHYSLLSLKSRLSRRSLSAKTLVEILTVSS